MKYRRPAPALALLEAIAYRRRMTTELAEALNQFTLAVVNAINEIRPGQSGAPRYSFEALIKAKTQLDEALHDEALRERCRGLT